MNQNNKMRDMVAEYLGEDSPALFADGFDDAIIGISVGAQGRDVVVYDYDKCIEVMMKRDEMDYTDAVDFLEYNTVHAWLGDYTPIFVKTRLDM